MIIYSFGLSRQDMPSLCFCVNYIRQYLFLQLKYYGREFNKIFKSITVDNGSEFAELSSLEEVLGIKVYYAHPYSSFERGTNERHNGLIRRFIPKGFSMNNLSQDDIDFIVERINSLPRKILGYKTPDQVFEQELDLLYAA